jgi:hypothetical protein
MLSFMRRCSLLLLQEDQVAKVGLSRYSKVSRSAFGLNGKKRIAILRAGGAILGERAVLWNEFHSEEVCQHEPIKQPS